jgi:hypothetical protein
MTLQLSPVYLESRLAGDDDDVAVKKPEIRTNETSDIYAHLNTVNS